MELARKKFKLEKENLVTQVLDGRNTKAELEGIEIICQKKYSTILYTINLYN